MFHNNAKHVFMKKKIRLIRETMRQKSEHSSLGHFDF